MGLLSEFCTALDKVIIVAGPTASGKSAFASQLAQENKGVILNGDSLQVYCGLEILTAQPSLEDQQRIPHRLYGFLQPHEVCSAGKWLSLVVSEIEKCHKEGRLPIIVGGSGLYLKGLTEGLSPIPSLDPSLRRDFESREQTSLYTELKSIDPALTQKIKPQDRQRTLRALEVYYGTGKPLSFWYTQKPTRLPYRFEKILLNPSKEELEVRIVRRLNKMFQKEILEEVEALLALFPSFTARKAIGLQEIGSFLKGECSWDEAKALTLLHTLQYAKRQRTWFRHQFKADRIIDKLYFCL